MKRSEITTRRAGRNRTKKLDLLSLECIVEKLIENEEEYAEASGKLNKVWAPKSVSEEVKKILLEATNELDICSALINMEEGYNNPMNFRSVSEVNQAHMEIDGDNISNDSSVKIVMNNKIIEDDVLYFRNNRKIKKFWSSDALKGKSLHP